MSERTGWRDMKKPRSQVVRRAFRSRGPETVAVAAGQGLVVAVGEQVSGSRAIAKAAGSGHAGAGNAGTV